MTIDARWSHALALVDSDEQYAAAEELRALLTDFTVVAGSRASWDDEAYARAGLLLIELLTDEQELAESHRWAAHLNAELGQATNPSVVLLLAQAQFADFVAGEDADDAEETVDALRASAAFLARHADAATTQLRRLHARASLIHATLLGDLGRHREAEAEFVALAARLHGGTDAELRGIRLDALYEVARRTAYGNDHEQVAGWDTYLDEAVASHPEGPTPAILTASARRLQALRRLRADPRSLLAQGRAVLQQPQAQQLNQFYAWHDLAQLLRELCTEINDIRAADAILELSLDRFGQADSPVVRTQVVSRFRSAVEQCSEDDVDYTERDVHLMLLLLAYFSAEADPGVQLHLAIARSRLGNAQIFLRRPREGEATLAALITQGQQLTERGLPELLARAHLNRAIALSDLGREAEAQDVYAALLASVVVDEPSDQLRAAAAEAAYWHSRTLREHHDLAGSDREIDALLARFAHDESPAVRLQAANALFSTWQSELGRNDAVDNPPARQRAVAAMTRYGTLFSQDSHVPIQRLNARRLLRQASMQAADGAVAAATMSCREILDRYGASKDAKLVETVTTARESLSILSLGHGASGVSGERSPAYLQLRAQIDQADELSRQDRKAEAAALYLDVADRARGSADPETRLMEIAALGQLCFDLLDSKHWEAAVHQARRMLLATATPEGSPVTAIRALRLRAQAWLHLGIALGRLGDRKGAIAAYDSLAEFVVPDSDGDTIDTMSNGLYNRAVLIDESGDPGAAVVAYEKFVEFQRHLAQTERLALLEVKAVRNKTIALTALGRHAEAADASRRVLAICAVHHTNDFAERARTAAFALADSYRAQGDFEQTAATYAWMLSGQGPSFSPAEVREIQRLHKQATKAGRRGWFSRPR